MTLSQLQSALSNTENVSFILPNGTPVSPHFHVTEVGMITKHFIDCGGTERIEKKISLQLWIDGDYDHRLLGEKFRSILELSKSKLGLGDLEIEVEYQGDTIGKFGLEVDGDKFQLTNTQTACLASDACGIEKPQMIDLTSMTAANSCAPGSGCC